MQQTSGLLFTDNLGINEDLTNKLQTAGQHVANMVEDFKSMGEIVAPIVVPAVEALGTALGVVLDNAGKITAAFVAWKAFKFTQNLTPLTLHNTLPAPRPLIKPREALHRELRR